MREVKQIIKRPKHLTPTIFVEEVKYEFIIKLNPTNVFQSWCIRKFGQGSSFNDLNYIWTMVIGDSLNISLIENKQPFIKEVKVNGIFKSVREAIETMMEEQPTSLIYAFYDCDEFIKWAIENQEKK